MQIINQSFDITQYKIHLAYLETAHQYTTNQTTFRATVKKSSADAGNCSIYFTAFYSDQDTKQPFIDYYAISKFDFVLENEAVDLQSLVNHFTECYNQIFDFIKSNHMSYPAKMSYKWIPFDEPKDFMLVYLKQFQAWPQEPVDEALTFAEPDSFPEDEIKSEHELIVTHSKIKS